MAGSGDGIVAEAVADIVAEAEGIRGARRLPAGFEKDLDRRFDALAQDRDGLERAVAKGALEVPQTYASRRFDHLGTEPEESRLGGAMGLRRLASGATRRGQRAARNVSRRGATTARRLAGPRLRSLERKGLDQVGAMAEEIATFGQVAADHARRVATSGGSSRRLERISPGGRALPSPAARAATRAGSGSIGALDPDVGAELMVGWAIERVGRAPTGRVLHVESGEGGLVARLAAVGFDALGADPAAQPSETVQRAGALERLGGVQRSSLASLILSGVTDEVSPASARALAHLARSRLQREGTVIVVSAHPRRIDEEDPVTADLTVRRPLHPVTWCHLLARHGFSEITVFDPAGGNPTEPTGTLFAISGRLSVATDHRPPRRGERY